MKLRFDHQSIRMRVRKSDIEKLSQDGFVEETVHFPANTLIYRLEIHPSVDAVTAGVQDRSITVRVPVVQADAWIQSESVGIYATVPTGADNAPLTILIEKDFPCRHNSLEDNADTFTELSPD